MCEPDNGWSQNADGEEIQKWPHLCRQLSKWAEASSSQRKCMRSWMLWATRSLCGAKCICERMRCEKAEKCWRWKTELACAPIQEVELLLQVNVEGLPCFIFPMHTSLHYNAYFIVIMVINTLSPQVLFVESLLKVNFGRVWKIYISLSHWRSNLAFERYIFL